MITETPVLNDHERATLTIALYIERHGGSLTEGMAHLRVEGADNGYKRFGAFTEGKHWRLVAARWCEEEETRVPEWRAGLNAPGQSP